MTTFQHSDPISQSSNAFDVFKCIRQSGFLKKHDYNPKKLKVKCTNNYTSFPGENQWKVTSNRRTQQKYCGFFAKTSVPYKEFGNVELNSNKLLLESLQHIGNWFLDEKARIISTNDILEQTKSSHDINNNQKDELSLALVETSSERKIQNFIQRDLQDYLQPSVNLLEIPSASLRKQNDFLEKIKCFEILFHSVQNMNSKDLKNKTTLSSDTLKKLRQEPIEQTEEVRPTSSTLELNNKEHKGRSSQVSQKHFGSEYQENISTKSTSGSKNGNDAIPPWFKSYSNDEDDYFQNSGNNTSSKFHKDFLRHFKHSFQTTQNKLNEKMKNELDSRVDSYLQCIKFLQLKDIREKDLRIMRKKVKDWRYKFVSSLKVPEKWFEILVEQQITLQLKDNEAANEIVQRLTKYKHLKLAEFSELKFCLLIFSLPAYELCTYPMKEAAQYYSNAVLNLPGHILNEWLKVRKLT